MSREEALRPEEGVGELPAAGTADAPLQALAELSDNAGLRVPGLECKRRAGSMYL